MRSNYLSNLTYIDRSLPLLGTLFSTVFCNTLMIILVYLTNAHKESDSLLTLLAAYLLPFLIFAAGAVGFAGIATMEICLTPYGNRWMRNWQEKYQAVKKNRK